MPRLVALFCAVFLVLSLSTGAAGHAEQRFDCLPTASVIDGHFDGDADESSGGGKSAMHHHSGCNGHQLASASASLTAAAYPDRNSIVGRVSLPTPHGREPDGELRPPIA